MSGWLIDTGRMRVEGDVDWNTPIECNGGEVLVEEGFKEDNLVPVFQEGGENRVLTWILTSWSDLAESFKMGATDLGWRRW